MKTTQCLKEKMDKKLSTILK